MRNAISLDRGSPRSIAFRARDRPAGGALEVGWSGPDADGDRITLASPGAAASDTVAAALTRFGSPATLRLPDATGPFELRYEQYEPKGIHARRPITPPAAAAPGERFETIWSGPAGPRDKIVLSEPGSPDDAHIVATGTRWGSPAKLKAPDRVGTYELRSVVGASGRIIARMPVTVGDVE